ncbi:MAG: NTPase [Candidatus Bathyarchaeota archaeon BA1]|nr:MAG: NTPase [Candidatus Bathyarchaeota archaeon BA1]
MVRHLKRLIFVTGRPGIGKTSVLLRAVDALKARGYKVGGMISREVREGWVRVGFEIIDFCTGQRGWLAHVNQPVGPQVSKYRVNLSDLNTIGANSIRDAVTNADIIVIDEIGPMELFSTAFKESVVEAMKSGKPMLGTIHHKARDPLITTIKARKDVEILEVTYENRAHLHNLIINKVVQSLQKIS